MIKYKEVLLEVKTNNSKLFGKSFKERDNTILPLTPQEAVDYSTKVVSLGQCIIEYYVPNTQLRNAYTREPYSKPTQDAILCAQHRAHPTIV